MYLNCHTYFSFKYGTLSPEDLFEEARRNKVRKLAVTDINNTSAFFDMYRICLENRDEHMLEVIPGIEFREGTKLLYTGIAASPEGFEALNRFLTCININQESLPSSPPEMPGTYIIYPPGTIAPEELKENEFLGIRLKDTRLLSHLKLQGCTDKLVIWHPVTFSDKTSYNVHRLLRAVDENTLLSKLRPESQASADEIMMPESELLKHYWDYPLIISNTRHLLESCEFHFDFGTNKNKKSFTGSREKDHYILRTRALEGFRRRYEAYNRYAMERLLRELDVIAERNFEAYFLISLDIVRFAREKGFAHVGRGSGANSMVAYCLGITEVDPIELDLYFERFLNPYRSSPPDFDIDFSWKNRDEVTTYMLNKYKEHASLLATYTTFQGRSIIRELGKVFGLPKSEIDALVEHPLQYQNRDNITRLIFRYAERFYKMPQNLSIHAGGVIITELPVTAYTALDLPPKGFPVTHFDMVIAEDMGIHKFDILSQRGLGHIKDTVEIVRQNQEKDIDISRFSAFKEDPGIKKLLRQGKAMGCFYVESPAMRLLLGKLRCDDYLTLVAASSIIRPGVARSGMMREYIFRHLNPGKYEHIHPKMAELMHETYGVMVYQEDVIKVAHHFAGLDLAEADILRRGMSGKFRSRKEFQKVKQKFFDNCRVKGYPGKITEEVWRQIESFSGYSFSKAHSASYAVESYQSLFLKAHYPLEFMVGVINNFGGFYHTEFYFHEARMDGANIEAPCVNNSEYLTSIHGKTIFIGFIHLKSLETRIGEMIPVEREQNGFYRSFDDFLQRIPAGLEQMIILIRSGAFRFTGKTKRELLWEAHFFFGKTKSRYRNKSLFESVSTKFALPPLNQDNHEDAFDELELLGFPLCNPYDLLAADQKADTLVRELNAKVSQQVQMTGYLVTTKSTHTKDHKLMHFGTFIDREGAFFDTTHFPDTARKHPFRGKGFYSLRGKVVEDFGYPMIEVTSMEKLPMVQKVPETV